MKILSAELTRDSLWLYLNERAALKAANAMRIPRVVKLLEILVAQDGARYLVLE